MIDWPRRTEDLAAQFREAAPFPHVVLDGLVGARDLARLRADFDVEPMALLDGDLYEHLRSAEPPVSPALRELCEALHYSCGVVGRICGRQLSRVDGAAYVYLPGHHLLPHSDFRESEGRAVAYAYYVDPPASGGELELFSCTTRDGQIVATQSAKRIEARANRLVLFEVNATALHQVCEVLEGARTSVAGWFYP